MLERVPGSYLLIGNGTGEGAGEGGCMVHNPGYDFNDANIGIGSAYWVLLAQRFLTTTQLAEPSADVSAALRHEETLPTH
jgi:hippurate hydrolase